MAKIAIILLSAVCFLAGQSFALSIKEGTSVDILVSLKGGIDGVLEKLEKQSFGTKEAKIQAAYDSLTHHRDLSQDRILSFLKADKINHKSIFISNQIYIQKADLKLIEKLKSFPEVSKISLDERIPLIRATVLEEPVTNAEWGVEKIEAPLAWAEGWKGAGAKVGIIDTGARYTHEAISGSYAGAANHGWYDPYDKTENPFDENGQGTHIVAIIAGSEASGVGVAPDAKWLSCRGCEMVSCQQSALLECGQFMLCPTDFNGNNANCSLSPDVVSNSWGGGAAGSDWFDSVMSTWRNIGIVGLFAGGNSGPSCASVGYPASSIAAIGITASTDSDSLLASTSRGPSGEYTKPDLIAPGVNIRSAYATDDSAYATLSGSSIASPHVAGTLALMFGKNPNLNAFQATFLLYEAAERPLPATGQICGGIDEEEYPNNGHGWGRVNAFRAAELA